MNLNQAMELIAFDNAGSDPQLWLDLGSGTGLFTVALSHYLPETSTIIAVDKNERALQHLPSEINNIQIETKVSNFIEDALDVKAVDGILMANSLHYVKDKISFLQKLLALMKTNGCFLLVEYNRSKANQWVPYPLTIDATKNIFREAGFPTFTVLNKMPSVYGGEMYAALIS